MDVKTKRNIRDRWIESLFEIAHLEYQNRLWIKADYKNRVGDYNECVCGYFDDLDLENGYSDFIANGIISESEFQIVSELHSEFKIYTERIEKRNLPDKNILKDIEWKNVTDLGLKTWTHLKEKMESPRDKELMIELENKYLTKKPPNNI